MKRDIHELLRKIQLLLVVALAAFPIHWIVAAWRGGSLAGYVWLYSLGFVALGTVSLFIPGKLRIAYGVSACAAVCCTFFTCPVELRVDMLFQTVLFAAELFWSLQVAAWKRGMEIPGFWISLGILAHLAAQILLLTDWAARYPGWMPRLAMYGFVLLTMLSVNRRSLVSASGKQGSVSLALGRRNILLILILFLIALGGALIPSAFALIRDILVEFGRWIGRMVSSLLAPSQQSGQAVEGSPLQPSVGIGEGGRPLGLPPIIETIIIYIGAAISVGMLLWIMYRVGKKILKAILGGWSLFGRFLSGASEDYVDEVTDTRENGTAEGLGPRRRVRARYREDPSLPPGEQVRRRYLHLKLRHPEWTPGSTAREKLPEPAAVIYERIRYSAHPASEEDPGRFAQATRDI